MRVEEIMIASAHAADTLEGKTQQTFRRLKGLSLRKRPSKVLVVNSAHYAYIVVRIDVYLETMVAAVH